MEMALKTENVMEFKELSSAEIIDVNGGAFPVLFIIWGVKVTVGHCLAAGAAVGLAAGGAVVLKN